MKPSHLTTPRTLADCTFTVDYSIAEPKRYSQVPGLIIVAFILGALLWTLL